MLSVTDKGAFTLFYSQEGYRYKIIEGDGHNDEGHKDCVPLAALGLVVVGGAQGQHCDEETYNERAGVTHKYFGGREIECEEAEQCSYEDKRKAADEDLAALESGGEQVGACYDCDAGGGAVHIVEEVKDVDNQHYPEGGE